MIAFGVMACCIITYQVSLATNDDEFTIGSYVMVAVAGLVLLGWMIWFIKKYISGRKVIVMPRKAGRVSEVVNWILFALWILTDNISKMCHTVWVVVAWCLLAVSLGYYFYYCNKYGFTD